MRAIDADALIAWIKGSQQMTSKMKCVIAKIETMPDAVSVVHGEWIDIGWKGDWQFETDGKGNCWYEYECSECGFRNKGSKSNFCPNCGADMRGEMR